MRPGNIQGNKWCFTMKICFANLHLKDNISSFEKRKLTYNYGKRQILETEIVSNSLKEISFTGFIAKC